MLEFYIYQREKYWTDCLPDNWTVHTTLIQPLLVNSLLFVMCMRTLGRLLSEIMQPANNIELSFAGFIADIIFQLKPAMVDNLTWTFLPANHPISL